MPLFELGIFSEKAATASVGTHMQCSCFVNRLPDNKILGLPKLKAFADEKSNVTQNI